MGLIERNQPADEFPLRDVWPDSSLAWVVAALFDDHMERSAKFFDLDQRSQFLAVDVLRTLTRAALDVGQVDDQTFVAATIGAIRDWLATPYVVELPPGLDGVQSEADMVGRDARLARTLVALAATAIDDDAYGPNLENLLLDACLLLLNVSAAGLVLVASNGTLEVTATSNEQARMLQNFEVGSQEGPCIECLDSGEPVSLPNLNVVSPMWPRFATAGLAAGFHSLQVLPMRCGETVIGVLTVLHSAGGDDCVQR